MTLTVTSTSPCTGVYSNILNPTITIRDFSDPILKYNINSIFFSIIIKIIL